MMQQVCSKCLVSFNNYFTCGNNSIISIVLTKYDLLSLIKFMEVIHVILTSNKKFMFEIIHNFNITEDSYTYTLDEYVYKKINESYHIIGNNETDVIIVTHYMFILKSLFIISIIMDNRVKLFILGDHDLFNGIACKINMEYIDIFLDECIDNINDFQNNGIQLTDIAYYATMKWCDIGLYVRQ